MVTLLWITLNYLNAKKKNNVSNNIRLFEISGRSIIPIVLVKYYNLPPNIFRSYQESPLFKLTKHLANHYKGKNDETEKIKAEIKGWEFYSDRDFIPSYLSFADDYSAFLVNIYKEGDKYIDDFEKTYNAEIVRQRNIYKNQQNEIARKEKILSDKQNADKNSIGNVLFSILYMILVSPGALIIGWISWKIYPSFLTGHQKRAGSEAGQFFTRLISSIMIGLFSSALILKTLFGWEFPWK